MSSVSRRRTLRGLSVSFLVWAAPCLAATSAEAPVVSVQDTYKHYGERVTVDGVVAYVEKLPAGFEVAFSFLYGTGFHAWISSGAAGNFPAQMDTVYPGKRVRLIGIMEAAGGRPRMMLTDMSQVRLLGYDEKGLQKLTEEVSPNKGPVLKPEVAAKKVSEVITVEGDLDNWVPKMGVRFEFGEVFGTGLKVAILPGWLERFSGAESIYYGKRVRLRGHVQPGPFGPEIVLTTPKQVTILGVSEAQSRPVVFQKENISADSAAQFYGQEKSVEGFVYYTYDAGSAVFMNFDRDPFHPNVMFCVILRPDLPKFPARPARFYRYKKIQVTGKIVAYQGRPEIVLRQPAQVRIVGSFENKPVGPIPAKEADQHVGQFVTVEGVIVSTRATTPTAEGIRHIQLGFGPMTEYNFVLLITGTERDVFPNDPVAAYLGKKIQVAGFINRFKGRLEMMLDSGSAIRVIEAPQVPLFAAANYSPEEARGLAAKYLEAAQKLAEEKHYDLALAALERGHLWEPGNTQIQSELARLAREQEMTVKRKLIEEKVNEGYRTFQEGRLGASLRVWQDVLRLDPSHERAREYVARVATMLPESEKDTIRVEGERARHTEATEVLALGETHLKSRRYDEAIRAFERARATGAAGMDEKVAAARQARASAVAGWRTESQAALHRGDLRAAAGVWETALKLIPDDPEALQGLRTAREKLIVTQDAATTEAALKDYYKAVGLYIGGAYDEAAAVLKAVQARLPGDENVLRLAMKVEKTLEVTRPQP